MHSLPFSRFEDVPACLKYSLHFLQDPLMKQKAGDLLLKVLVRCLHAGRTHQWMPRVLSEMLCEQDVYH